ncbi:hypothetical protein GALMADRAFT_128439 [Galerina marginata CBS 339.88]|uniref:G domain-containing protein n=1 Tax=Galerina marginata (strain CBS 339.88) TaxID=685588 RepID=A0A067SSS9_GALM3|nr:hypothetical protein GALMADRAFT_128439 [Galerina marginata CBS 339.88]
MGPTGAGKSYFINSVLNHPSMPVGSDLDSCTTELGFGCIEDIQNYPNLTNRRIVLIDTPGFDSPDLDDKEMLEKIITWLKQSQRKGAEIGGVIYLHDITKDRFSGTARQNLRLFQDMCRDDALKNVVLVTTKWSRKSKDSEKYQLQLEGKHWKTLIDKGAKVHRFDQGSTSAWAAIDMIICAWDSKGAFQTSSETKIKPPKILRNRLEGFFHSKRWWAF